MHCAILLLLRLVGYSFRVDNQAIASIETSYNSKSISNFFLSKLLVEMADINRLRERERERERESITYPALELSLLNCSKIDKRHVCLKEIAWKASESSCILETFSSDISLKIKIKESPGVHNLIQSSKGIHIQKIELLNSHGQWYTHRDALSLQEILISSYEEILCNIQYNFYRSSV